MPKAPIAKLVAKYKVNPQSLTVDELRQLQQLKKLQREATQQKALPTGHVVTSRREVAEFFGRGLDAIDRWSKAGMPTEGHAKYDLAKIAQWRLSSAGQKTLDSGQGGKTLDAERQERLAVLKERKLTLRQKRLVEARKLLPADEVREQCLRKTHAINTGLQALGRMLAPQLVNCADIHQIESTISQRVNALRLAYAEGWDGTGEPAVPREEAPSHGD
jgi:phage terminase Nu1 subunit (DNA packaging protein)